MSLVQITAGRAILDALLDVPDLNVVMSSVEPRGPDRWKVAAYASDAAVEAATALGAQVRVVLPTADDAAQRQDTAATIARERAERGER